MGNLNRRNSGDYEPDAFDAALAEVSGPRKSAPAKRKKHHRPTAKSSQPSASHRATAAAQAWVSQGEAAGVDDVANVNWLANRLTKQVTRDEVMRPMLKAGEHDKVSRLLAKMAERYWAEYYTAEVRPKDAVWDFLDEVWVDLRDYSITCLRAAYVKEHGIAISPPEYAPKDEQAMQKDLEAIRLRTYYEQVEAEQPVEGPRLDSKHRGMLKSRQPEE